MAAKLKVLGEILSDGGSFAGLPEHHRNQLALYAGQLATSESPYLQCWAFDSPPEVVQAYLRVEQMLSGGSGMSLKALRVADHWTRTATDGGGQGAQSQPVTLTWSIVADGTPIISTRLGESTDPSNLRARLASLYGGSASGDPVDQPWFPIFQAVFDNLAANSGLTFIYEPSDDSVAIDNSTSSVDWGVTGVRGDIRLSGHSIDGDSGVLAYAYYPDNGDVVIDTADNFYDSTGNNSIRLRNVLEHEIGHSLGLAHVCPVNQTKLMEPFVTSSFRGSQFDDIYSHQRNYGDPLEVHGAFRNNDTAASATPVEVPAGTSSSWEWLSIDDSSDTDHFGFAATPLEEVTIRIIPSDPIGPADPSVNTYLEGAQLSGGSCSSGTAFDPTNQQDLALDLIGPDGSVVASAPSRPAGETEEISRFRPLADGIHLIRVRGGAADRAQLYRMEVLLEVAPLAPRLAITATRLDAESNSGGNGLPDPDETLRLGITLANVGNLAASDISASLNGPTESMFFIPDASYGSLSPGTSAEQLFTFALAGSAGSSVTLNLTVVASDYSEVLPLTLDLGSIVAVGGIAEDFDGSSNLPAGWSQSASGAGKPWRISDASAQSLPYSVFSPGVIGIGDAILVSPAVIAGPEGGALQFRHRYDLEERYDGAVLEASRGGGPWFDLLNSAATVVSGDYNNSIWRSSKSSINNREAWTGASGEFVNTVVHIPASWAGESIRFRWLSAHDKTVGKSGWHVDDVSFFPELPSFDPFRPFLSLTASGSRLIEEDPDSAVTLTLTTPLPLVADVHVVLDVSGTADPGDLEGSLAFVIPAGETQVSRQFAATPDELAEGREFLTLSIPPDHPDFAALAPDTVSLELNDPSQTAQISLSDLVVTFDGNSKGATATTVPAGLEVELLYDGSPVPPVNAGTYVVDATVISPGYSGSSSGTFVIVSAYRAWISTFADADDPDAPATGDLDRDGWDNAAEYLFGTLPDNPASRPRLVPELTLGTLRLIVPDPPAGMEIRAETSTGLDDWTTNRVIEIDGGFEVARDAGQRFLRIVYEVVN